MCSQRLNSTFLKIRRLQFIPSNERSLGQTSGLATGSRLVTQEVNDLGVIPGIRRDLGDQQPQRSLAELPSSSYAKRKPDHLPRLISSAGKGHAPDPNPSLSIVSKRIFQGDSVVEGPEDRRPFVGHSGLPKNSPKVTAGEAQGKKRAIELLNKARKQTEKASNLIDIRQLPKQEEFMSIISPCKKYPKQQPMSLEEWRRGRLGGDDTELIQSQEPFGRCESLALEEKTFLQGKKIKPYCRGSDQIVCPLLVGEQGPGEGRKPVPSGQEGLKATKASKGKKAQTQLLEITSLQAEAKIELVKRKRMQVMEMSTKPHNDRGLCLEKAVLSGEEVQLSPRDIHQGAPERNNIKPKSWPRAEGWDHMVQGTSVVLTVRDHSYVPHVSKYSNVSKPRLNFLSK